MTIKKAAGGKKREVAITDIKFTASILIKTALVKVAEVDSMADGSKHAYMLKGKQHPGC